MCTIEKDTITAESTLVWQHKAFLEGISPILSTSFQSLISHVSALRDVFPCFPCDAVAAFQTSVLDGICTCRIAKNVAATY